ncbi:transmembrane protein 14A isoform X1 [Tamandua tetradactyla]|uniref:transmembrane protein 14A isoform X1 n=1 Tax=Tamandua tetradactyla TaxID=48850 RepID=UPI0040547D9E
MDLLGFGYAALVTFGSILGYKRRGGVPSLIAGLFVGFLAGYGAYRVSNDRRDIKVSLFVAFFLATIMGVRFKRSKKIMPAGLVAGLSAYPVILCRMMSPLHPGLADLLAAHPQCPSFPPTISGGVLSQTVLMKVLCLQGEHRSQRDPHLLFVSEVSSNRFVCHSSVTLKNIDGFTKRKIGVGEH